MQWLVFSYSLPSKGSSSSRVTLWRRLQRLGAISITGTYVLPKRDDCLEALTWLSQEIRTDKGEALIMEVEHFVGLSETELVTRFHAAQAEAYKDVLVDLKAFEKKDGKGNKPSVRSFEKLRKRFLDLKRVDYFDSPVGKDIMTHLNRLEQRVSPQLSVDVPKVNKKEYQGRTWVTRPQPHVDRLASAWLIKRFIDSEATIAYRAAKAGDVTFDTDEADFGHVGQLCTFETLLAAFSLEETALKSIAQIVHEIDLRDERYARAEIAGIDALLDGWLALALSDEELEQRGADLFEGLYQRFSQS